jgi:hypothetical protein
MDEDRQDAPAKAREQRHQRMHEAGISTPDAARGPVLELHVCMGLNSCKHHDKDGSDRMAGMGKCATVQHVCHGDGACRGQGACGYAGTDYEQALPGDQSCNQNGSCASPINASRVFSAGPYKGKSVWKQARRLFEARMYDAGVPFGPSPGEGIADDIVPPYELDK